MRPPAVRLLFSTLLPIALLAACGYSDEQMAARQREIDNLKADTTAVEAQIAEESQKATALEQQVERRKALLRAQSALLRARGGAS